MENRIKTDLDYVKDRYKKRIQEHGVTFDSMKSGSEEKQLVRHKIHASSLITATIHLYWILVVAWVTSIVILPSNNIPMQL